jgi:hypothetical protein
LRLHKAAEILIRRFGFIIQKILLPILAEKRLHCDPLQNLYTNKRSVGILRGIKLRSEE